MTEPVRWITQAGFSALKYNDRRIRNNQFDAEFPENELSYELLASNQ